MREVLIALVSMISLSASAQLFLQKFEDREWAYYNRNIEVFNQDGIGTALTMGISEDYVVQQLAVNEWIFHQYSSIHMPTMRYVDFSKEYNQKWYWFDFAEEQHVSLAKVLIYLGTNYTGFFRTNDWRVPYLKEEFEAIKDTYKLEECTRFVFDERWYIDHSTGEMFPHIFNVGFMIPDRPDIEEPIVWLDLRFIEKKVLERIQMNNMAPYGSLVSYLQLAPYTVEELEFGFSSIDLQTTRDPSNIEIEPYAYREATKRFAFLALHESGKKENFTGEIEGSRAKGRFENGKPVGEWVSYYPSGKTMASVSFSNDQANGEYELYYPKGKKMEEGTFARDLKQGKCLKYNEKGKPLASTYYRDGRFEGQQKFFHSNKKPYMEFSSKSGRKDGWATIFYDDGVEKMKGQFKNGYIYDKWTFNIKMEESFCGFLKDQEEYDVAYHMMKKGAMDDCIASFEYTFTHEYTKDCFDGFCVLPSVGGYIW